VADYVWNVVALLGKPEEARMRERIAQLKVPAPVVELAVYALLIYAIYRYWPRDLLR
jgi:hypothetical protein